jgi:hypothetical protein
MALCLCSLAVVTVLVYANSLSAPFVYDDFAAVRDNPTIRDLWPLTGPLSPPARDNPTSGRPLVNLSLAVNYAVGGLEPRGYHVANLAIHVGCALLLFGIIWRTLRPLVGDPADLAIALVAAALWAVHPLNSEPVNHITARTESMMAFCYLLTLYAGIRAGRSKSSLWPVVCVAACAAGMACKESMVTAPILLLLYDRVFGGRTWGDTVRARRWLYGGLAASWIVFAWLNAAGPRGHAAGLTADSGLLTPVSPWTYLLNQAPLMTRYLRLAVWPADLVLDYGLVRALTLTEVWAPGLTILLLLVLTAVLLLTRPQWGFLAAWFFRHAGFRLEPGAGLYRGRCRAAQRTHDDGDRRRRRPRRAWRGPRSGATTRFAASATIAISDHRGAWRRHRQEECRIHVQLSLWRTVVDRWPHGRARHNLAMAPEGRGQGRWLRWSAELRLATVDYPDARSSRRRTPDQGMRRGHRRAPRRSSASAPSTST